MKPQVQRKGNVSLVPGRHVVGASKLKKGTNKQKGTTHKASGALPFGAKEVLRQLSASELPIGTQKEATIQQLKSGEMDPVTKIKLQLFPVDEITRIGLMKDGLNPFLELTLKARKKISSVIKHIHTKWGGSSIAIGEPTLLPYDKHLSEPAMSLRWTSKDSIICAGDVYSAVGCPAVFRLSYGWFSDKEAPRVSTAAGLFNYVRSESIQKQTETTAEGNWFDSRAEPAVIAYEDTQVKMDHCHDRSISTRDDETTNLSMGRQASELQKIANSELKSSQPFLLSTDISIGGFLSEASLQGILPKNEDTVLNGENMDHQRTPIQWDDGLTALSIGGLLSEISMQAKINKSNPKSSERDVMGHPSTFVSDSFDNIISSQVKTSPQVTKPSSFDSRSSILDAEETCHAFAFKKFSSNKNVRDTARASQDLSSNTFRFPDPREVDKQAVRAEDISCPEPKLELFPCPQQFGEDSRSLGLRGINWNESLGPFDFGNSMAWMRSDGGYL